jgi:hypothetical protein
MKLTPEEERLATCARLYAEYPDNTAAWGALRKAALGLATSLSGRKPRRPKMTEAEIQRVRQERDARVADKKRRRQEWEASQRRGR